MSNSRPVLTLSVPVNSRSKAMIDGVVKAEGIELQILPQFESVRERHVAMVRGETDVSEMSTSNYIRARLQMKNQIALPIFFIRGFRQGNLFCRDNSGIKNFSDLKGKTIGVTAFGATTIVWLRGILHSEYGVTRDSVKWITAEDDALELSQTKVNFKRLNKSRDVLWDMLKKGSIDAAIFPGNDGYYSFNPGGSLYKRIRRHPGLVEVQCDLATIREYYQKTKIYPIIHIITIKQEVVDRYPEVAQNIIRAFRKAKETAFKYADEEERRQLGEEIKFLGRDPYEYRLIPEDKKAVETLMDYMIEDGSMDKRMDVESLFSTD